MGLLTGKKTSVLQHQGKVVQQIPIEKISPDPNQPRKKFVKIEELAESIIAANGIQNPIHVVEKKKNYQIIMGERRYHAAKYIAEQGGEHVRLGKTIPCIVYKEQELDSKQLLQLQVIENLQREDLTALEEARAYKRLVDDGNMTQTEVAKQLGVSKSTVSETIRILTLPKEFLEKLEVLEEIPPKRDLYKIAREKDEEKQQKMMAEILKETTDDVSEETPDIIEDKDPQDETERQFSEDDVWEMLKKAVKKDKRVLLKLISKSKLTKLQEIIDK